ncbi:UDP-glucose/GDP-mannose dehydrogenase family protein [Gleimia sp. 6138-11-ORH1]|uniref:UDP-glucose dehydrogenase family protein n=1 Tax=Gleimia sp. 6138-11-ORH1 TaxID=2973937 RepID=UPI00216A71F9|nr:UDP-glucose/GDP-mannose dehydrogenase family protein [Gleimia sp. 6138-11-ORH1]MCS4484935.1 UDP-glucose/GDP-mannose dehydrogenase family protein [Gleimia sp. 6138-11-ORH1]
MKISVIGCGYLGAVHAACMAYLGHDVLGIDVDQQKVDNLNAGKAPFYEPGFPEKLSAGLDSGKLIFTTTPQAEALKDIEVHFIAVGTPQGENGAANLTYLWEAVELILDNQPNPKAVIVGKSTVPVGTAQQISARLETYNAENGTELSLIWNPEFLREGFAVEDTLHPDRIVYGTETGEENWAQQQLDKVYEIPLGEGIERILADYATAELVKTAANSFLAMKISFINAMAELCEATGGNVTTLAQAIGKDKRIGHRFLGAGLGFGGGCLPKDIRAFGARAKELGVPEAVSFLTDIDAINKRRRDRAINLSVQMLDGDVKNKKIAILGAAFKPNSDDIRDSPALEVAVRLQDMGAEVVITDPQALPLVAAAYPQLSLVENWEAAVQDAELVVLGTEWDVFKQLDPVAVAGIVSTRKVIDGRNVLSPQDWKNAGWEYHGMGRS